MSKITDTINLTTAIARAATELSSLIKRMSITTDSRIKTLTEEKNFWQKKYMDLLKETEIRARLDVAQVKSKKGDADEAPEN